LESLGSLQQRTYFRALADGREGGGGMKKNIKSYIFIQNKNFISQGYPEMMRL